MRSFLRLLLLSTAIVSLMAADGPPTSNDPRFQKIGDKIMCSCGCAQMLLKCNHIGCPNSERMRKELATNVTRTTDDEEVLNFFRKTWGVTSVVEPSNHGFELLAWIMPGAGLGLGLLLVVVVVRSWRFRPAVAAPADVKLGPELEKLRERARRETEL